MRYFLGIIILIIGVSLLLNNLGLTEIEIGGLFSTYWPVIFLFWGFSFLYEFIKSENKSIWDVISGVILVTIGVSFLLRNMGWLDLDLSFLWKLFWPIIFILIGISLLIGKTAGGKKHVAFMGGVELGKKAAWDLKSDSYYAVMGGVELDLTKANIPEGETLLDMTAVMGGIEILIPENVPVVCEGITVLGGIEFLGEGTGGIIAKKTMDNQVDGETNKLVRIQARALMGGIEVKSI
ncbi:putative membrane protein [Desulfitispora alkaliphila]|uniref:LiaF domain-containing protein n=1 Tax=Desulfitispora alkaliphila TaxID=622674 RepID=UPI003D1EAE54